VFLLLLRCVCLLGAHWNVLISLWSLPVSCRQKVCGSSACCSVMQFLTVEIHWSEMTAFLCWEETLLLSNCPYVFIELFPFVSVKVGSYCFWVEVGDAEGEVCTNWFLIVRFFGFSYYVKPYICHQFIACKISMFISKSFWRLVWLW